MGTHLEPPKSSKPIIASSFEIDPEYIEFIQKQPFSGEGEENPYTHLREFYRVCDLLRIEGMSDETLKWKLFPFSLTGKARHWYKLKVGSVHGDWKELYSSFLSKYFPISKVVELRREILSFRQLEEESLGKSWDRFINLTLTGPKLSIPEEVLLIHFFEGLSRKNKQTLHAASGGSFHHLSASEAWNLIDLMSGKSPSFYIPEKEKEPVPRQEEEVSIARSQPLQSQTLAIDPKPSIPQNSPREEGIPTLNLLDADGLDFWFYKRPSSRDNSNHCNNVSLRECPGSYHEEVEDDISSEGELSHIDNSIYSPSMFTSSKSILDLRDPSYPSSFQSHDDPSNSPRRPNHRSHEDHKDGMSSNAIEGELSHIENSNTSPILITSSKWLECVEWMDKEEALMGSDFGSISNGEFLTPFEDEIHPTTEEDIGETNPGETPNIQIGDEDNINEHGIYFIATSFTPCSYATSSQSIGLSDITTLEISNPLFLSIYKNFKRAVVDAYVYNKYCRSR
jgi:hypothetical protein